MKVIEYTDCYLIHYNEGEENGPLIEIKADYKLINGRNTTLEVFIDPSSCKVIEILADITLQNEDIGDISELRWIVGKGMDFLRVDVPPVLQFWQDGEFTLLACLRSKEKNEVATQLLNLVGSIHNVSFRPNYTFLKSVINHLNLLPAKEYEIPFYTFKDFVCLSHIQDIKDKGTEYARAYQKWRTAAMASKEMDVTFKLVFADHKFAGKPAFQENNYMIEHVNIKKPIYMGSQFDNMKVIICTFHSHDISQSENTDVILFSYINRGLMERQWMVYVDPSIDFTPDVAQDIIPMLQKKYDKNTHEFHLIKDTQPLQTSRDNGYYLIPDVSTLEWC